MLPYFVLERGELRADVVEGEGLKQVLARHEGHELAGEDVVGVDRLRNS